MLIKWFLYLIYLSYSLSVFLEVLARRETGSSASRVNLAAVLFFVRFSYLFLGVQVNADFKAGRRLADVDVDGEVGFCAQPADTFLEVFFCRPIFRLERHPNVKGSGIAGSDVAYEDKNGVRFQTFIQVHDPEIRHFDDDRIFRQFRLNEDLSGYVGC